MIKQFYDTAGLMKQQQILKLVDETTSLRKQWAYQMPVWWNNTLMKQHGWWNYNFILQEFDETTGWWKQQFHETTG